jgi:hypothetical protein
MTDVKRWCRTCKYAVQNPVAENLLCQHPNLPCMRLDPKDFSNGVPGVSAAMISGHTSYRYDGAKCAPNYAWWEPSK